MHAAVIGVDASHRILATLIVWTVAVHLVWGVATLLRPSRMGAALGLAIHTVSVGAWLVTRLVGISWIGGLEVRGRIGFADAAAAGLSIVIIGISLGALLVDHIPGADDPARLVVVAFAVGALTLPAMVVGGTRTPSSDSPSGDGVPGHVHPSPIP
jgi:hypothetical protein